MFGNTIAVVFMILTAIPSAASAQVRLGEFVRQVDGVRDVSAIAFSDDGTLYAIDAVSGAVLKINDDSSIEPAFDSPGETFRGAQGLALGTDGRVYVSDTSMHRVVMIGPDGAVTTLGSLGVSMGQFNSPRGIALSGSSLAVADSNNARVHVFNVDRSTSDPMVLSAADGAVPMVRPVGVAIEKDTGRVFAVDQATHRVYRFSASGLFETSWGGFGDAPGLLNGPTDIQVKQGRVYIADASNHRVQVFDTDGAHLYWWGLHTLRPHDGEGRVHYPSCLALNDSGELIALGEAFEDRVQFFGRETDRSRQMQEEDRLLKRGVSGHFGRRLDAQGTLMAMIEPETASVIVYDTATGVPIEITRLGGYGTGFGRFVSPAAVAVDDKAQHVYVADNANGRVSVFLLDRDPEQPIRFDPGMGRLERAVDLGTTARYSGKRTSWPPRPIDLVLSDDGSLLVLDGANGMVLVLDQALAMTGTIIGIGYGAEELRAPASLCELPDGRLAITLPDEGSVAIFGRDGFVDRRIKLGDGSGSPFGIEIDGDSLLVTDASSHTLQRISFDGEIIETLSGNPRTLGKDDLYKPAGIVRSETGLYLIDYGNHRLVIRESVAEFRSAFGPYLYVDEANGVSTNRENKE